MECLNNWCWVSIQGKKKSYISDGYWSMLLLWLSYCGKFQTAEAPVSSTLASLYHQLADRWSGSCGHCGKCCDCTWATVCLPMSSSQSCEWLSARAVTDLSSARNHTYSYCAYLLCLYSYSYKFNLYLIRFLIWKIFKERHNYSKITPNI